MCKAVYQTWYASPRFQFPSNANAQTKKFSEVPPRYRGSCFHSLLTGTQSKSERKAWVCPVSSYVSIPFRRERGSKSKKAGSNVYVSSPNTFPFPSNGKTLTKYICRPSELLSLDYTVSIPFKRETTDKVTDIQGFVPSYNQKFPFPSNGNAQTKVVDWVYRKVWEV